MKNSAKLIDSTLTQRGWNCSEEMGIKSKLWLAFTQNSDFQFTRLNRLFLFFPSKVGLKTITIIIVFLIGYTNTKKQKHFEIVEPIVESHFLV